MVLIRFSYAILLLLVNGVATQRPKHSDATTSSNNDEPRTLIGTSPKGGGGGVYSVTGNCATPFGSPCGPTALCIDMGTGFRCEELHRDKGCPAGCGRNESCVKVGNEYVCECNDGFHRSHDLLPCLQLGRRFLQVNNHELRGQHKQGSSSWKFHIIDA